LVPVEYGAQLGQCGRSPSFSPPHSGQEWCPQRSYTCWVSSSRVISRTRFVHLPVPSDTWIHRWSPPQWGWAAGLAFGQYGQAWTGHSVVPNSQACPQSSAWHAGGSASRSSRRRLRTAGSRSAVSTASDRRKTVSEKAAASCSVVMAGITGGLVLGLATAVGGPELVAGRWLSLLGGVAWGLEGVGRRRGWLGLGGGFLRTCGGGE
jgi:hypothetical protein